VRKRGEIELEGNLNYPHVLGNAPIEKAEAGELEHGEFWKRRGEQQATRRIEAKSAAAIGQCSCLGTKLCRKIRKTCVALAAIRVGEDFGSSGGGEAVGQRQSGGAGRDPEVGEWWWTTRSTFETVAGQHSKSGLCASVNVGEAIGQNDAWRCVGE
jgi:hypothetical protein